MPWNVALCRCNGTLPWDPSLVQRALGLAAPPALFDRLPRDEIHRFMDLVGGGAADRWLVACCGPEPLFREAVGAAGGDPERTVVVDARPGAFWPHPDPAGAAGKATRLLRAATRLAESGRTAPELPVRVGPTVLIATDSPAGLALARRLGEVARPVLLLDERSAAFDAEPIHPLPWPTSWGTVAAVEGSVGGFRVEVRRTQPLDLRACVQCHRCVPVCHTSAISEGLRLRTELCDRCGDCLTACGAVGAIRIPRSETETLRADQVVVIGGDPAAAGPRRTGYHRLPAPAAGELDALAWTIASRVGEFRKADSVAYDPDVCAGGAAGHESCGICIGACPYAAIARDPGNRLRVRVDGAACEGCGACVAACPTSALTFTDPPPAALHARMAALLAPLPGRRPEAPVLVFHCPEQGAAVLADAGRRRLAYPASALPVPMACLRHVADADILAAFRMGAAGVALLGCEACPHGPREPLLARLALVRAILDAFGAGGGRVALLTGPAGDPAALVAALDRFARSLGPPPLGWDGTALRSTAARAVIGETVRALLDATGREPGRVPVAAGQPFGVPDVRAADCTLSRACVNVCPTHAFRFVDERQTLELTRLACVACGLCVAACPERAIAIRAELPLDRRALDWDVVVRDQAVGCVKCGKPFGNRKALEAVEAKLQGMGELLDVFAGPRRRLLRMCPSCRAVAAVLEMQQGWEP
jgi:ferredoxin